METINSATILETSFEAAENQEAARKRKYRNRLELTADFQRLNVLLLRAVTGKMIGTALLTESKIHATVSTTVSVSGSLGGLQVMNLMSGSTLHQKILSVGKDPMIEDKQIPVAHLELYGQQPGEERQALTFSVLQRLQTAEGEGIVSFKILRYLMLEVSNTSEIVMQCTQLYIQKRAKRAFGIGCVKGRRM